MTIIDKTTVQNRFGRSATTYHQAAHIQRELAARLAVATQSFKPLKNILEVGCGTGFLTRAMLAIHRPNIYHLNDLAPEMVAQSARILQESDIHTSSVMVGDAETIDFPKALDAIVSSSTIQWFSQPARFFEKSAMALRQGGLLAVGTFGPLNFKEIKSLTQNGLNYAAVAELRQMLSPWFEVHSIEETTLTQWFESPASVLSHMRHTGVNCLHGHHMGAGALRRFMASYTEQYANSKGQIPLTWHPITMVATKK